MMSRVGAKPACRSRAMLDTIATTPALLSLGAARPVIAVRFLEFEWIVDPVGAFGLDDVHVRHQQNRLFSVRTRGWPPSYHRLGVAMRLDCDDPLYPGTLEFRGQQFDQSRHFATAGDGRNLDDLAE